MRKRKSMRPTSKPSRTPRLPRLQLQLVKVKHTLGIIAIWDDWGRLKFCLFVPLHDNFLLEELSLTGAAKKLDYFLSCLGPLAPANNPSGGGSGSKTCSVCWDVGAVTSTQTVSVIATKTPPKTRSEINKEKFLIWKELRKRMLSEEDDNSATTLWKTSLKNNTHGHDVSRVMVHWRLSNTFC